MDDTILMGCHYQLRHMNTDDKRPLHGEAVVFTAPPGLPAFASFATRTAADPISPLHEEEAATLHPRAVPDRHETFRLGRSAAHAALGAIGADTGPVLVGSSREPLWPAGVSGSISHISGIAVALIAPSVQTDGVGIDIETIRNAPELDKQIPRPEERIWLDRLPAPERTANLFALFSAKESIFKAFYPRAGFFFGFQAASLVPVSSGFVGSLVEEIDSNYPPTRTFEIKCEWLDTTVMTWLILPKTSPASG